eukprot:13678803-Alexandrium_andersonii.AAC.1
MLGLRAWRGELLRALLRAVTRARSVKARWSIPGPGLLAGIGVLHDRSGLPDPQRHGGDVADAGEADCCRQHPGHAHMAS